MSDGLLPGQGSEGWAFDGQGNCYNEKCYECDELLEIDDRVFADQDGHCYHMRCLPDDPVDAENGN